MIFGDYIEKLYLCVRYTQSLKMKEVDIAAFFSMWHIQTKEVKKNTSFYIYF